MRGAADRKIEELLITISQLCSICRTGTCNSSHDIPRNSPSCPGQSTDPTTGSISWHRLGAADRPRSGNQPVNILTKLLRVLLIPEYRSALFRTRVVASTEHDRILAGLQLNTVVDIGASRGQFALCIRRLYPHAQIFSFEPLRKPEIGRAHV